MGMEPCIGTGARICGFGALLNVSSALIEFWRAHAESQSCRFVCTGRLGPNQSSSSVPAVRADCANGAPRGRTLLPAGRVGAGGRGTKAGADGRRFLFATSLSPCSLAFVQAAPPR